MSELIISGYGASSLIPSYGYGAAIQTTSNTVQGVISHPAPLFVKKTLSFDFRARILMSQSFSIDYSAKTLFDNGFSISFTAGVEQSEIISTTFSAKIHNKINKTVEFFIKPNNSDLYELIDLI